ncbi:MAG TPA: class I SAM-dependent methyltransferase [Allosphingosinicella sp.]|jgi:SAM-dependent methyltransferase|nr:class I SAM-dependent methyltransferase [Allosphingosinicella sp.]
MSLFKSLHRKVHGKAVFDRRIEVLTRTLADFIPANARVLDIGCGSGTLARRIMALRPDISIEGIDVLVRPGTEIPVTEFDGDTIPWADGHFDIALFVDVLHHTEAPARLLAEAKRVSRGGIVIKDHFREGVLADATLRFMDWVGNAQHGVVLPYNYLSDPEWRSIWSRLGLKVERLTDKVGLYPAPFSWLFDRRLHFVARLA